MRTTRTITVGLIALLFASGAAFAGSHLNEVGAMLVYPSIIALNTVPNANGAATDKVETFLTITNAGQDDIRAHISYINGEQGGDFDYCDECNGNVLLTANDTDTLSITVSTVGGTKITTIASIDEADDNAGEGGLDLQCFFPYGFIVVTLEKLTGVDPDTGAILNPPQYRTASDNVLLGEQVYVNYTRGHAFSISAVSIQGGDSQDGNRNFRLDDAEYGKLPRFVAADFLARQFADTDSKRYLSLFTTDFVRRFPPLTTCSVTGYDAFENPFSGSLQFGCWAFIELCDISPEFCYPFLGTDNIEDTHGWISLNCAVDRDPQLSNGTDTLGGVHGALISVQDAQDVLRAGQLTDNTPSNDVAWGRLLYQSVQTGSPTTLVIEEPGGNLNLP